MSYTKGVWVVDDREDLAGKFYSDDATGSIIGECQHYYLAPRSLEERKANAKRIVDCVNSCDGMESPADEVAKLRQTIQMLTSHLESCANELTSMIDAHNEQNMEDGSWKYDHQTPWEALHLIEAMKVK